MTLQEEYLSDKHCLEIKSEKAIALVIIHLSDFEDFFNFIFDRKWKIQILDLEKYIQMVKFQPKHGNETPAVETRRFHKTTKIPVCLMFDDESPFRASLDYFLYFHSN